MKKDQSWQEEFDEKFVPLSPGFSEMKDWTKVLEGTTANYMTLKSFISKVEQEAYERGKEDAEFENNKLQEMTYRNEARVEARKEIIEMVKEMRHYPDCKLVGCSLSFNDALDKVIKKISKV